MRRHGRGRQGRHQHVEIAIAVAERARQLYPAGLPTADIRSPDEPLLGVTNPETSPAPVEMEGSDHV